jgi:hypothetical protein
MALFYHPLVVFAEPWNLSKVITVMFFGILFVETSGFTYCLNILNSGVQETTKIYIPKISIKNGLSWFLVFFFGRNRKALDVWKPSYAQHARCWMS